MAAKFTNTHHRIFHKSTKGQGTTVLPPNSQTTNVNGGGQGKNWPPPTQTTAANGGKPQDGEVSSVGRASGGGDVKGDNSGGATEEVDDDQRVASISE